MGGFASERELGASIRCVQQVDLAHCYVHLGLVWFPQGHLGVLHSLYHRCFAAAGLPEIHFLGNPCIMVDTRRYASWQWSRVRCNSFSSWRGGIWARSSV